MASFSASRNRALTLLLPSLFLLLAFFMANLHISDAQIGVCYGMLGDNLPSKQEVVDLYRANNIQRMRIYDPNQEALDALRGSGIELILGIPNENLQNLAASRDNSDQWAQNFVFNYYPSVNIKYIAVGNEVSPVGGSSSWASPFVLPAIQNVYQSIRVRGLQDQIKVTTAIDMSLLGNSYPPSQGRFRDDVRSYLDPIIGYLVYANAPLLANVYPYLAYPGDPTDISLPYAVFTSPNVVVWDGSRGYQNLFDAMLDAIHAALDSTSIGYVRVVVSESGWPSDGAFGANYDNAETYLQNLIGHVNGGTPMRPGPTETYIFAMFDENQKSPELEKHWGLFFPNKQKKYPFGFGVGDEFNVTVPLKSDI